MADSTVTSSKSDVGWQTGRTLLDCHQYMFDNQIACDVHIQYSASDNNEQIGAHRYILMCRSPVFENMLTGDLVREAGTSVTIDMPDAEPAIFKEVLKYMYYDSASIAANNVLHILHNAKKYQLNGLVKQCMTFLESNMSVANSCTLLNTCAFDEVMELCIQYMRSHPTAVLGSTNFLGLNQEALNMLLTAGLMFDQKDVFDVCLKWARNQHDQIKKTKGEVHSLRDILGKCIYHLGFRAMTSAELAAVTKDAPILSDAEQLALFRYAALPDEDVTSAVDAFGFTKPPLVLTTRSWFDRIDLEKHNFGNHNEEKLHSSLCFSVDKPILLYGFSVFGPEKSTRYSLTFELHGNQKLDGSLVLGNAEPVSKVDTRLWSRGSKDPIRVVLPKPVEVSPSTQYRIHTVLGNLKKSSANIYRGVGQAEVVNCGQCVFSLFSAGHHNNGLIAQLLYSIR